MSFRHHLDGVIWEPGVSLHENSKKDAHNNACIGNNIKLYETRNCIIHTTQAKKVSTGIGRLYCCREK